MTDAGAEGTPATNAPLSFQHVHAQQPPRLHRTTTEARFFLLVADSTYVHPQQPVNTSVFAVAGYRTLIPDTFTNGNFRFLHSSRLGVTCHPYNRCRRQRGPRTLAGTRISRVTQTARPLPKERPRCHHPRWKTNIITEKKTTRYAITQPNRFHSRFDFGHHAQNAYPASSAFGTMINICSHAGHSG